MHANIQASMAVRPSALGVLVVTVLKMFTKTRKSITSNAMRPEKRHNEKVGRINLAIYAC